MSGTRPDPTFEALYQPEPDEVVVVSRNVNHYFTRGSETFEVVLERGVPTVLSKEIATQLLGPGFQITDEAEGRLWRRMTKVER